MDFTLIVSAAAGGYLGGFVACSLFAARQWLNEPARTGETSTDAAEESGDDFVPIDLVIPTSVKPGDRADILEALGQAMRSLAEKLQPCEACGRYGGRHNETEGGPCALDFACGEMLGPAPSPPMSAEEYDELQNGPRAATPVDAKDA